MDKKQKIILVFVAMLVGLNFFCWKEVFVLSEPQKLRVDFFSVGQGDSFFIETPAGNTILIDGGPDGTVLGKLAENMPFWDREIDLVILTHPDSDHMTGLIDVLQKYKVDNILWTGISRDGDEYQKWLALLATQKKMGAKVIIAKSGEEIKSQNVLLDVLHPFTSLSGQYFKTDDNDTGVVAKLIYGKESFLFSADITSKEEQKIVDIASSQAPRNDELRANVLKVAHHGSKYSTSNVWLGAVEPQMAVISDGKNNMYHFPTTDVLNRLQNFGIKVLRTDEDGDVDMVSDGSNIKILNN